MLINEMYILNKNKFETQNWIIAAVPHILKELSEIHSDQ